MTIELDKVSRSFGKQTVISELSCKFLPGRHYAVTGPNGCGKSTLLKLIAGFIMPDAGTISYTDGAGKLAESEIHQEIAIAAPYLELIEEFSLEEMVRFHFSFKKIRDGYSSDELYQLMGFTEFRNKFIRDFSSGMKQRVRLTLALLSDVNTVLLDEPCTNLDQEGIDWYANLVANTINNGQCIVFSNEKQYEYPFCHNMLKLRAGRLFAG